jgi:two-component system sensor histidine kinase PilS (NtrC family)
MAADRPMEALNQKEWLLWLIRVRIVIITFLLGIELAVVQLTQPQIFVRWFGSSQGFWFVSVILLWYALTLFFALLVKLSADYTMQSYVQMISDIGMITAVIHITGGVDSYYFFLYPLVVILAAIALPQARGGAFLVAGLSFIFSGTILELAYYNKVSSFSTSQPDLHSLQLRVFTNLILLLPVVYLSSSLVENLRKTGTRLKAASSQLENLQAFNQNVIDSMSGGLLTTNLEGRVLLLNRAGALILGVSPAAAVGHGLGEVVAELSRMPLESTGQEIRVMTEGGREKYLRVTISQLTGPEGAPQGMVYFFQDLTELKRLERQVGLQDRMAALGRMAAAIAHEIRNPLASIAGSVQVFASVGPLSHEQRRLVDIVAGESQRLDRIISDFLNYSRERHYEFRPADLHDLLDQTLALLAHHPEATGIRLERAFCRDALVALVDADAIKQVFWNICDNALKAMPAGGRLKVETAIADGRALIGFRDSGIGFEPGRVEKIFEPFQSFSNGTGLGLAIVYEIITAHQGAVQAESPAEGGSLFRIELPVVAGEVLAAGV